MRSPCALIALLCATDDIVAEDSSSQLSAPGVVVTGSRFLQRSSEFPVGVQLITSDDIQRSGALTISGVLAKQAGIVTRDNSGSPNRQIDLRGFGVFGDQNTLVLLNGQRISENEQTPADLASIALSDVERIEIMRGSGAVLYGGGATAGTINVITRAPQAGDRSARISSTAGSYGTWGLGGHVMFGGERLATGVSVNHLAADNYRSNNDLLQDNFQAEIRWLGDRGPIGVTVAKSRQDLRLPGSRTATQIAQDRRGTSTPDDSVGLDSTRTVVSANQKVDWGTLAADVSHRERQSQSFQFGGFNSINSRVTGFSPRVYVPFSTGPLTHALTSGIDWDSWDFRNRIDSFSYSGEGRQRNSAFYVMNTISLNSGTRISLGVRQQRVETDILESGVQSSRSRSVRASELAVRQTFGNAWSIYAKAGSSFRLANIDDVRCFCAGSANFLEPQTSDDREVGLESVKGEDRFTAALFRSNLENEILFDPVGYRNVNLPPTQRLGLEITATKRWSPEWLINASYSWNRARFREGALSGFSVAGKEMPLVPAQKVFASVSFLPNELATVTASVAYVGTQRFDNDQVNTFNAKMPSYLLVDLTATYLQDRWRVRGSVLNLLGTDYFTYGIAGSGGSYSAYPAAGRSAFVAVEYFFDGR